MCHINYFEGGSEFYSNKGHQRTCFMETPLYSTAYTYAAFSGQNNSQSTTVSKRRFKFPNVLAHTWSDFILRQGDQNTDRLSCISEPYGYDHKGEKGTV